MSSVVIIRPATVPTVVLLADTDGTCEFAVGLPSHGNNTTLGVAAFLLNVTGSYPHLTREVVLSDERSHNGGFH